MDQGPRDLRTHIQSQSGYQYYTCCIVHVQGKENFSEQPILGLGESYQSCKAHLLAYICACYFYELYRLTLSEQLTVFPAGQRF